MRKISLKHFYSRGVVMAFAVIYSLIVVVASTLAWVTNSDTRINEFNGDSRLKTVISEDFRPVLLKPDTVITKKVSVHNEGSVEALVRISFEEVMMVLELPSAAYDNPAPAETTEHVTPEHCYITAYSEAGWVNADTLFGTVNLPTGADTEHLVVRVKEVSTNTPDGTKYIYAIYYDLDDGNYQTVSANFAISGNVLNVTDVKYWGYSGVVSEAAWGVAVKTSAIPTPPSASNIARIILDVGNSMGKIALGYGASNQNLATALTSANDGKWYYNPIDGFFYYLGALPAGGFTSNLLESLKLDQSAGVTYTGVELDLIINLESIQADAYALMSQWGLSDDSSNSSYPLYQALARYCD